MQRFYIFKKFKQLEEPNISKGQQPTHTTPAPCPTGDPGINHQGHVRKRSACHIPGKAREDIAAKSGTQARSSSNVNCKNNSTDCKLAHRVGFKYPLDHGGSS